MRPGFGKFEKSLIREEDQGPNGLLVPAGPNADVMRELQAALREGFRTQVPNVVQRLQQGDASTLKDATDLSFVLSERSSFSEDDIDSNGLINPMGPNADLMQKLIDAVEQAKGG